jgi:hypothetical protein
MIRCPRDVPILENKIYRERPIVTKVDGHPQAVGTAPTMLWTLTPIPGREPWN